MVMFLQVCVIPSVHGGGGGWLPTCITGHMTRGVCIQEGPASGWGLPPGGWWVCIQGGGWACPKYYGIWSTNGQYTSYWNAFLFMQIYGRKLRLVAVRKLLLVFVFGTNSCKKITASPNSNSTEKLYL